MHINIYLSGILFLIKAVTSENEIDDIISLLEVAKHDFRQIEPLSTNFISYRPADTQYLYSNIKRRSPDFYSSRISEPACDCGVGMINCLNSRQHGRICECESNTIVVNGMCADCTCSNGVCIGETGQCKCLRGFGLENNTCVECDCGEKKRFCHFIEGLKFCNCDDDFEYVSVNEKCEDCVCGKSEVCLKHIAIGICTCPKNSATWDAECDDRCDCSNNKSCVYTGLEKLCKCMPRKAELNGECIDCYCGQNSECQFVNGEKNCTCDNGYELHNGTCEVCNCGDGHSCTFKNGSSVCLCAENHMEHNGTCKECSCGPNELCELIDGQKVCTCKKNHIRIDSLCIDCWCGEGHDCEIVDRKKVCICREGFSANNGTCEECNCGVNHACQFQNGTKECECLTGYAENAGMCEECFCGKDYVCFYEDGDKICACPNGHLQRNKICTGFCTPDTCDRGICEEDDSGFHCNCEKGYSGIRCDEAVIISQGAIYLISVLSGVTLFWIILLVVYIVRKRNRYRHFRNEKTDFSANCGLTMSMLSEQNSDPAT